MYCIPAGNDNKEAIMNHSENYNSGAKKQTDSGREQSSGAQAGNRFSTMSMVQVAIFGAVICIMAFTPFLGYIPLGFTRATIIHVPVIIASLLMGPKKGAALGFLFGMTSFINNTMNPTPTSFVFTPFYSIGDVSGGWGSMAICMYLIDICSCRRRLRYSCRVLGLQ